MRYVLLMLLVLPLGGCFMELLATTAIRSKLDAENVKVAQKAIGHAEETTNSIKLEQAIAAYRAETGVFPPSLEALVPEWLDAVPAQSNGEPYAYDPTTGQLLAGAEAAAFNSGMPTSNDFRKMQRIRSAITQYGTDSGYYPPNLEALTPHYLDAVPLTDSGEQFVFNAQNGALLHPKQASGEAPLRPVNAQGGSGAYGGGTPMTEAVTGLGVQRQLNNMNQAGANAAGNRARGGAQGIADSHSNRQLEAIEELGL